ncbi:hypothetical protein GCM10010320_07670 [Streptomyces caelestis]|nr:hypothetical protein GCM10010320_07670 [Streptomyces caelestis]
MVAGCAGDRGPLSITRGNIIIAGYAMGFAHAVESAAKTAMAPSPLPASVLGLAPVVPVVVIDDAGDAVPLARALVAGGLPAIEVMLRTPAALERSGRSPGRCRRRWSAPGR